MWAEGYSAVEALRESVKWGTQPEEAKHAQHDPEDMEDVWYGYPCSA